MQVQQGTIRLGGVLGAHALFHHHSAVVLNAHDVGVGECDLHQSGLLPGSHLHDDLQVGDAFQQGNAADLFAQQFPRQFQILRGDVGKHLQLFVRVAAHGAQHRAGLNAFHVACGGHNDRFDVFDDVAAAPDINVLRQSAQNAARLGRRVGNSDRLGTAKRRNDFLAQDGEVFTIDVLIHSKPFQTMRFCVMYDRLFVKCLHEWVLLSQE